MAKTQYNPQELFILRNHIPVDSLIEKLNVPSKTTEGCFRFCCPVCREFDTGVNPKTNLARCFRCEKNYNTIDLVMLVKQSDFIHSVKFLQTIYEQKNVPAPSSSSPSTEKSVASQPVSIGNILKSIEPTLKSRLKSPAENDHIKPTVEMLNARICQLEHQVSLLSERINTIQLNR